MEAKSGAETRVESVSALLRAFYLRSEANHDCSCKQSCIHSYMFFHAVRCCYIHVACCWICSLHHFVWRLPSGKFPRSSFNWHQLTLPGSHVGGLDRFGLRLWRPNLSHQRSSNLLTLLESSGILVTLVDKHSDKAMTARADRRFSVPSLVCKNPLVQVCTSIGNQRRWHEG